MVDKPEAVSYPVVVGDLVAYLSYPDAGVIIDWLSALGFTTVRRADVGPRVIHAELRRRDAVVMMADDDAPYAVPELKGQSTGSGIYLVVAPDEVDALFAAAIANGGRPVIPPEDTPWAGRRARVLDPGGREWTFGSYVPGSPSE